MPESKTRRRQIRLTPSQDDALIEEALRRGYGVSVSELFVEAATKHFNLPNEGSQTADEVEMNDIEQSARAG